MSLAEEAARSTSRSAISAGWPKRSTTSAWPTSARAEPVRHWLISMRPGRFTDRGRHHRNGQHLGPFGDRQLASGTLSRFARSLQEALSLYRDVGDKRGEAKALTTSVKCNSFGLPPGRTGELPGRSGYFGQIGGTQDQAIVYHNIGTVYYYKGSYEKGLSAYRRALAIYRELGDLPNETQVSTLSARSTRPRNASTRP